MINYGTWTAEKGEKLTVKHLTFVADEETVELIEYLKKELRAPTTAALFRKALSLTKLAVEETRDSGGVVTLKGKGAPESAAVSVALRV